MLIRAKSFLTVYAQIELRNTTIKIRDGYTGGGGWLVNNGGGYMTGAVTMLVDGGTTILVTGDTFTVAGETGTPTHTITAHSETSSVTSSITFTPALASSVVDDAVITILPHILSVKIGEGNLTYSEKRKIKYVTDRGLLDTVRLDDDEPMDVKLDFTWEFLRTDTAVSTYIPTPEEAIKQVGNASTWISSAADKCEVYAVDIVLLNTPPCPGVKAEQIVLPFFRWEDLAHDPKTAQIAITGKCNNLVALVTRI